MASNLDWISFFLDFFRYLKKKSWNKNNESAEGLTDQLEN